MITVYGNPNTRAFRVLWMLEELGIPYTRVPVDFATGETRQPRYLAINPNGHVPALVDGELRLFESLAINLYLAERYGTPGLRPDSLEDRARAVQWSFWALSECEAPGFDVLFARGGPQFEKWRAWTETEEFLATHPAAPPRSPEQVALAAKAAEAALRLPFRVLDVELADRPYLLGDAFGVADLNVASVLVSVRLAEMDLRPHPRLDAWLTRCTSRPAVARAARG
jgi:glutathione S-transferase